MQCTRQPRFLAGKPIRINHVLEVRLAPAQWNRIKIIAFQRRRTLSTITRFCVLRLARKCSLRWSEKLRNSTQGVKQGLHLARDMHRHLMCLYGDDEKIIRLAAIELSLTLTAFIRLAIELYLPALAMENHGRRFISDSDLTWEGIRFIEEIQIFAVNGGSRPFYRTLSCMRFETDSYW